MYSTHLVELTGIVAERFSNGDYAQESVLWDGPPLNGHMTLRWQEAGGRTLHPTCYSGTPNGRTMFNKLLLADVKMMKCIVKHNYYNGQQFMFL